MSHSRTDRSTPPVTRRRWSNCRHWIAPMWPCAHTCIAQILKQIQHMACWYGVSSGGWNHVTQFRTCPISAGGKLRGEGGWLTPKRSNKNGRMSPSFECLYCAKSKLNVTAARRNKSYSLSELESIIIQDTIFFSPCEADRSTGFWIGLVETSHRVPCGGR